MGRQENTLNKNKTTTQNENYNSQTHTIKKTNRKEYEIKSNKT